MMQALLKRELPLEGLTWGFAAVYLPCYWLTKLCESRNTVKAKKMTRWQVTISTNPSLHCTSTSKTLVAEVAVSWVVCRDSRAG